MDAAAATRFARQLALPQLGSAGQERLLAARVAIVGRDVGAETIARYLAAAGVGALRLVGGRRDWDEALIGSNPRVALEHVPRPTQGPGWREALEGASLVVRTSFDDDPMLHAAIRLGIPAITLRAEPEAVDVLAFRAHGPCPHMPLDVAPVAAVATPEGAASVVAGTLAATEALHILAGSPRAGRAHHLRVPLDGGDAVAQGIPWTPECFACGGTGNEMSFA
jgi:hypothetical protein